MLIQQEELHDIYEYNYWELDRENYIWMLSYYQCTIYKACFLLNVKKWLESACIDKEKNWLQTTYYLPNLWQQ